MAIVILQTMFSWRDGILLPGLGGFSIALVIAAWWAHFGPNPFEMKHEWKSWNLAGVCGLFALALLLVASGNESPFLYFQF
jgi:hypothetical protein